MPRGELDKPQDLLGDCIVFKALEGVDKENEHSIPLMHLQAGLLDREKALKEDWYQI